jgi:hypothetical protein
LESGRRVLEEFCNAVALAKFSMSHSSTRTDQGWMNSIADRGSRLPARPGDRLEAESTFQTQGGIASGEHWNDSMKWRSPFPISRLVRSCPSCCTLMVWQSGHFPHLPTEVSERIIIEYQGVQHLSNFQIYRLTHLSA